MKVKIIAGSKEKLAAAIELLSKHSWQVSALYSEDMFIVSDKPLQPLALELNKLGCNIENLDAVV